MQTHTMRFDEAEKMMKEIGERELEGWAVRQIVPIPSWTLGSAVALPTLVVVFEKEFADVG